MEVIAAYQQVGSYRGAAAICGTTHKTVRRIAEAQLAGGTGPSAGSRVHNYDGIVELVARRVRETSGRISAQRLLPVAQAAGYQGSARNFRRVVAAQKGLRPIVTSTALTAFGLPAQCALASAHHGKIRVRLLAGHQAIREVKVCATAKAAPANSTIGGKCHETKVHGYATLTGVPAGRWYITLYKLSSPVRSSPHKVKVHAGRTATYTYHEYSEASDAPAT